jgi:hypothetical protein
MPAVPLIIGITVFLLVKFFGYSYAGTRLNRVYGPNYSINAFEFGRARTLLGLAGGIAFIAASTRLGGPGFTIPWPLVLLFFFLIRMVEWAFLIWLFYERKLVGITGKRLLRNSFDGAVWSYILDLPAWLFVLPLGLVRMC